MKYTWRKLNKYKFYDKIYNINYKLTHNKITSYILSPRITLSALNFIHKLEKSQNKKYNTNTKVEFLRILGVIHSSQQHTERETGYQLISQSYVYKIADSLNIGSARLLVMKYLKQFLKKDYNHFLGLASYYKIEKQKPIFGSQERFIENLTYLVKGHSDVELYTNINTKSYSFNNKVITFKRIKRKHFKVYDINHYKEYFKEVTLKSNDKMRKDLDIYSNPEVKFNTKEIDSYKFYLDKDNVKKLEDYYNNLYFIKNDPLYYNKKNKNSIDKTIAYIENTLLNNNSLFNKYNEKEIKIKSTIKSIKPKGGFKFGSNFNYEAIKNEYIKDFNKTELEVLNEKLRDNLDELNDNSKYYLNITDSVSVNNGRVFNIVTNMPKKVRKYLFEGYFSIDISNAAPNLILNVLKGEDKTFKSVKENYRSFYEYAKHRDNLFKIIYNEYKVKKELPFMSYTMYKSLMKKIFLPLIFGANYNYEAMLLEYNKNIYGNVLSKSLEELHSNVTDKQYLKIKDFIVKFLQSNIFTQLKDELNLIAEELDVSKKDLSNIFMREETKIMNEVIRIAKENIRENIRFGNEEYINNFINSSVIRIHDEIIVKGIDEKGKGLIFDYLKSNNLKSRCEVIKIDSDKSIRNYKSLKDDKVKINNSIDKSINLTFNLTSKMKRDIKKTILLLIILNVIRKYNFNCEVIYEVKIEDYSFINKKITVYIIEGIKIKIKINKSPP